MYILAIKTFLKKAWVWTKNYWYVPLGALWTVVTWFFFRQKAAMLVDNFRETQKSHRKEIDLINKSKDEEVKSITDKVSEHLERDKSAEEKHKKEVEKTEKKVAARAEELRTKDNEELADELKKVIKKRKR